MKFMFNKGLGQRSVRTAVLALACCVTAIATAQTGADPAAEKSWVRVAPEALAGQGITTPYNMADLKPFIDKSAGELPPAFHMYPFRGQLLVDIVKTSGVAVHFPKHPDDGLTVIEAGTLTLTSDATGETQTFHTGDRVVIPRGWVGWWRAAPGEYRELAIASHAFFENGATAQGNTQATPLAIIPSNTKGVKTLYTGHFLLEEQNLSKTHGPLGEATDEAIQVLSGVLTLKSGKKVETFKKGDVVVIPMGLTGEWEVTNGYHAFVAHSRNAGSVAK